MSEHFGCVGNTIRLHGGGYLDFRNPKPEQFCFGDISGALSKICRFGAQIGRFYSVAEHSWNCWVQSLFDGHSPDAQRAVFAHDFAEAFVGDVCKPLKIMLPEYAEIERRVECAIAEKFQIDFDSHRDTIKEIDRIVLIAERRELFSADRATWTGEHDVRKPCIAMFFHCWEPEVAKDRMYELARRLEIV